MTGTIGGVGSLDTLIRSYLRSRARFLIRFFAVAATLKLVWLFCFWRPLAPDADPVRKSDLIRRRDYLLRVTTDPTFGPKDMPRFLPELFQGEWAMGTLSMTAASLGNLSILYPDTLADNARALEVLVAKLRDDRSLRKFDSAQWGEDAFDSLSKPRGHLGYLGHLNFVVSAYRRFTGKHDLDALSATLSDTIVSRMGSDPCRLAETYPGERYVPDNVAALASLRFASKDYSGFLKSWTEYARERLVDRRTGLLPFRSSKECVVIQGPRATGAGWHSFYLPFVDPSFQHEQFVALKSQLESRRAVGLRALLEWPRDAPGAGGDIDSGPVILGLSTSGTAFALAGARMNGDSALAGDILLLTEFVGGTVQWQGRRSYLLAPLVGDAILLAMNSAVLW